MRGLSAQAPGRISIHAPTRGATFTMSKNIIIALFQSTLPREERPQPPNIANTTIRFQSTLPREERHIIPINGAFVSYFNPRSHERSDSKSNHYFVLFLYFNPRSHERSDICLNIFALLLNISIHAPTRGATGIVLTVNMIFVISIHAPTRGATCDDVLTLISDKISIHAPTRGATLLYHA